MFRFTVKPDGAEPYEVEATSRDVVRWEAMGRGRTLGQLSKDPSMTHLTELAYLAAARSGEFDGDVKAFRAVVDVELHAEDEDDDEGGEGSDMGPTPSAR